MWLAGLWRGGVRELVDDHDAAEGGLADRILGRINSSYRLVAWGTRPLGAAAGGLLGELVGLRAVFGIAAGLILATLIGMTQVTDTAIGIAEHDAANIDGTVDMPDSG